MYIVLDSTGVGIEGIKQDEMHIRCGEYDLVAYGVKRALPEGKWNEAMRAFIGGPDRHRVACELFAGGYFIVLIDRERHNLQMLRDNSGLKTGYYHYDKGSGRIIISTNVHSIASEIATDISKLNSDFLLYQQYVPDGRTIYDNISEVRIGETLGWSAAGGVEVVHTEPLPVNYYENDLSESANINMLRGKILSAHEELAGQDNVVYLSGGIDSCVMLASLHNICPGRVRAVSYRIAGTDQDETVYASEVASHLGVKSETVTVDPRDKAVTEGYEQDLMSFNNPYFGNWIFRPVDRDDFSLRYFAGQDARLYTPAVNKMMVKSISDISRGHRPLGDFGKSIISAYERFSSLMGLYNLKDRRLKYSHLLVGSLDPESFIIRYKFTVDPVRYRAWGYDMSNFDAIYDWYRTDIGKGMSEREIFNRLIARKWGEQATNDIRYMTDMGRFCRVTTVLPFFQAELNRFGSTIPWELANKKMSGHDGFSSKRIMVSKYVLRKAFEHELPWNVMVRAKAVSVSAFLMMNGALGETVAEVLKRDLSSPESFCRRFGYEPKALEIISKNGHWRQSDTYAVTLAVYLSALCVYYRKNVLKRD